MACPVGVLWAGTLEAGGARVSGAVGARHAGKACASTLSPRPSRGLRHHPGTGPARGAGPLPIPEPARRERELRGAAVTLTQWQVEPPAAERAQRERGHRQLGNRLGRLGRRAAGARGLK